MHFGKSVPSIVGSGESIDPMNLRPLTGSNKQNHLTLDATLYAKLQGTTSRSTFLDSPTILDLGIV